MSSKTLLDCSTVDSTEHSLCALLGLTLPKLRKSIASFSLEKFLANNRSLIPYNELVLRETLRLSRGELPVPDSILWFHATRVTVQEDFRDGIQPLNVMATKIRRTLGSIAEDHALPRNTDPNEFFAEQGQGHYSLKISDRMHWGPFAFLVRDGILVLERTKHDYLGVPEAVEDIAGIIAGRHARKLVEAYQRLTVPKIVSFISDEPRDDVVLTAYYSLYARHWGYFPTIEANTCFDGGGIAIPASAIQSVERISDDCYPVPA